MEMQKVVLDENIIPPITHPWGKVWKQPDRNNLVLDDKCAGILRCCRITPVQNRPASITAKCGRLSMVLTITVNGIYVGVMTKIRYLRRYTFRIERF